ncbi:MAG: hypothetical protein KatS3mg031_0925 [Chitinophagales bacterium]|nr:MAG: hypothetical protein KatS3mg031_0925 [Chitinophagales bacterium]
MNKLKIFFTLVLFFFLVPIVWATHMAGGDLTYRCLGGNTYEITYSFYRDCSGIQAPSSVTLNYRSASCGINSSITLYLVAGTPYEITTPCPGNPSTCQGGGQPGIQKWVYRNTVNLAPCRDWIFSTTDCCRNYAITNINNPGNSYMYVEATLNNLDFPCNSSPQFTNDPVLFVCANQSFTYNHGVVDPDGDVLVYSLVSPLVASGSGVSYVSPYSPTNPLASNPPLSLNSNTGDITMRPTAQQITVMAVRIEQYRNGQLVGSIIRDMQVWVLSCNNNLPTATGFNGTNSFTTTFIANQNNCANILTNDIDPGQIVSISWNNAINGAIFFSSGSPFQTGTICWTPALSQVGTYTFTVTVKDNACPINGVQVYSYTIIVDRGCNQIAGNAQALPSRCVESANGVAFIQMTGGTFPFSYQWSSGSTTDVANNLPPGNYTVTVTDANQCTLTKTVTVQQEYVFDATIVADNSTCGGQFDGLATAYLNSIPPGAFSGGTALLSYQWNTGATSQTITQLGPGFYEVTVTDPAGCGDVASINLVAPPPVSVTTSFTNSTCGSSCNGSATVTITGGTPPYSFLWNTGQTTPTITGLCPGTYVVTANDAFGCLPNSLYTFVIGGPPALVTTLNYAVCEGEGVFAGGAFQTTSGTYYDTFTTAQGCDSVVVTILEVQQRTEVLQVDICQGESYFAGGANQTTSGTYYDTLLNQGGCDTVVRITQLTVHPQVAVTVDVTICDNETYFAGGAPQNTSGIYVDTLITTFGCDSIVTTNLTVLPAAVFTQNVTICQGESYFAGGANQTTSGTYQDFYPLPNGCDSIVTTILTVLPSSTGPASSVSICAGQSYVIGGVPRTVAGTYYDTLIAANGCDSIVPVTLTVKPSYSTTRNVEICEGQSYFAGGANQTTSGTYVDVFTSVLGCDSTIITNLTVVPAAQVPVDIRICDDDSVLIAGVWRNQPGTYYDTVVTFSGCTTIYSFNLSVSPNTFDTIAVTICEGDSFFAGGAFQYVSGTYVDRLESVNDCDSILTTFLTVLPNARTFLTAEICEGESYFAGGAEQTVSGTYYDTLPAANGCDSIIATQLIVHPRYDIETHVTICNGESYFAGGADQTVSGTYVDSFTTAFGCDSLVITHLTVLPRFESFSVVQICEGDSIFLEGAWQTQAGTYLDVVTNSVGCDSFITTQLEVISIPPTTVDVTACGSYFVGGALQTTSGIYTDTFIAASGCDSVVITNLTCLPLGTFTRDVQVCAGESYFAGGANQTVSGTYYDTIPGASANGCDSVVITHLMVADPLTIQFNKKDLSCSCINEGNNNDSTTCVLNFAGLPHGTILNEYFAELGVTITPDANGVYPDKLVVFNTNLTNTPDPDLQARIGNAVIFPTNLTDANNNGRVDNPDDQNVGGTIVFTFDQVRTLYGITLIDNDRNNGTITAYDESNNVIAVVNTPSGADGSVQDIALNIPGVKKFVVSYNDSRAITNIRFSCPPQSCMADISRYGHGAIVTGLQIAPGVTVTGISNKPAQHPNAVAVFNSNLSGTLDPDLQVGIGNLLILPEFIADTNGDGLIDRVSDSPVGGKMIFTFDRDRTVFSLTLVDNDRNNGTVKAFDANGTQLISITTVSNGNGGIQLIPINVSGVRRLELNYYDSRGVTNLLLDCEQCCDGEASAIVGGGVPPYSYLWSNGAISEDLTNLCEGTYIVTVTDQLGCSIVDSVTIGRDDADYTMQTVTICAGESFFAGGADQTVSGTYYDTLGTNDIGCFQVLVTELIVLPTYNQTVQAEICQGESYFAGGAFQTVSGTFVDSLLTAAGCDSIVVTELTVHPTYLDTTQVTICAGEAYVAGGAPQTVSGTYIDSFVTGAGCDSVIITELTVLPSSENLIEATICEGESYFAGGAFQTVSGTYYDTLTAANGCDSVVITELTVLAVPHTMLNAEICEGESYFAGGAFQTTAGTYYDTLTAANGCDSVVITQLTVHTTPQLAFSIDTVCQGQATTIHNLSTGVDAGAVYYIDFFNDGSVDVTIPADVLPPDTSLISPIAGTVPISVVVVNSTGCADTLVLTVVVFPVPEPVIIEATICEGESYFAGGAFQTVSGTYYDTLTAANGCDSVVITELTVLAVPHTMLNAEICEGESYFAGGAFQTTAGTYYDTLTAANGCDSVVITQLTVHTTPQLAFSIDTVCQGQATTIHNLSTGVDAGAVYYIDFFNDGSVDVTIPADVLPPDTSLISPIAGIVPIGVVVVNSTGCADTLVLTVVVYPVPEPVIIEATICEGESYFAGGTFQTVSGTYYDTLTAASGCDSVVITELIVNPSYSILQEVTICNGDSFFAGGAYQTVSGVYVDSFTTIEGCDSILTTLLTVEQSIVTNITVEICEGEGYFVGGAFQIEPGVYTDTFTAVGGCDSIVFTELIVHPVYTITNDVQICEGESYFAGGALQTESGVYTDTFTSVNGCDSIVVTTLTVLAVSVDTVAVSICEGESYFAGGALQTQSGTYSDTLIGTNGCDSVVITQLTVLPSSIDSLSVEICEGESYFAGGAFQTESGTYVDTYTSLNGCDSVVVTLLTVVHLDLEGETFGVSCFGAHDGSIDLQVTGGSSPYIYTWMHGFIGEDPTGLAGGSYSVTVTDANGCSATASFFVEQPLPLALGGVPTPVSCSYASDGAIDLTVFGGTEPYSFQWTSGQTTEDVSGLPAGNDTVTVTDANGCMATVIIVVPGPDSLVLSGTVSHESAQGANDGAIDLTVSGGVAPYTYAWSSGQTSEDVQGLVPGFYTVTVTDDNGCTALASFEILPFPVREQVNHDPHERFEVRVFPNHQIERWIYVEVEAYKERTGFITVHDMLGRKLLHQKVVIREGLSQFKVDMAGWAEGIYIIELIPEDNVLKRETRRVFKN